ncbi:MAG: helix-turn-helix transcriptional regulator [Deltaproteobacteria bacterium]|jgi:DNA-binding XRE family transcriptional regulator|nr:helix-turn-helix transcriptional regulator [Deltaproteobacteria bacterium]
MRGKELAKILGGAIAARRRMSGMTQEDLAGILDIAPDTLSRIEKGRFSPKMERLPDIARALKCSVADLFRNSDAKTADRASSIACLLEPLSDEAQETLVEMLSLAAKVMPKK